MPPWCTWIWRRGLAGDHRGLENHARPRLIPSSPWSQHWDPTPSRPVCGEVTDFSTCEVHSTSLGCQGWKMGVDRPSVFWSVVYSIAEFPKKTPTKQIVILCGEDLNMNMFLLIWAPSMSSINVLSKVLVRNKQWHQNELSVLQRTTGNKFNLQETELTLQDRCDSSVLPDSRGSTRKA